MTNTEMKVKLVNDIQKLIIDNMTKMKMYMIYLICSLEEGKIYLIIDNVK